MAHLASQDAGFDEEDDAFAPPPQRRQRLADTGPAEVPAGSSGSNSVPAPVPAPVPEPTAAPSDPVVQLTLALQSLLTSQSIAAAHPRPYVPDFRKDLNMTAWPPYSGDFRTFRTYKKDVLFTLEVLPREAHETSSSISHQSL